MLVAEKYRLWQHLFCIINFHGLIPKRPARKLAAVQELTNDALLQKDQKTFYGGDRYDDEHGKRVFEEFANVISFRRTYSNASSNSIWSQKKVVFFGGATVESECERSRRACEKSAQMVCLNDWMWRMRIGCVVYNRLWRNAEYRKKGQRFSLIVLGDRPEEPEAVCNWVISSVPLQGI